MHFSMGPTSDIIGGSSTSHARTFCVLLALPETSSQSAGMQFLLLRNFVITTRLLSQEYITELPSGDAVQTLDGILSSVVGQPLILQ